MWPARDLFATVGLLLLSSSISGRAAQVCSNGVAGVEADNVCCIAECGTCGGAGCRDRARAVALSPDDCCAQRISESGVYCDDSETAPCIMSSACSNGVTGVEATGACCVALCGTCGGAGCRDRAEAVGLTSDDCCVQRITASGMYCDDVGSAPCIIDSSNEACSNGITGVEADGACCVAECGACGSVDCIDRAEAVGLTSNDCCVEHIGASGIYCSDSKTAPCIINSDCAPSLVITLEWSDASSDIDLYVIEPDGTVVSYKNPLGVTRGWRTSAYLRSSTKCHNIDTDTQLLSRFVVKRPIYKSRYHKSVGFLENDDTEGFGPESYVILSDLDPDSTSILGEYKAQARVYLGSTESWNLTARMFGEIVWVEEGDFTTSTTTSRFSVSLTDYDPNCGGSFAATITT